MNRTYKLKLLGNAQKTDTALYACNRFRLYAEMFVGRIFFGQLGLSTAGMGALANQAQRKAHYIVKALKAASKITGNKMNVPYKPNVGCPATLEKSKNGFDYWVSVSNLWHSHKVVRLPAKSHKALNTALKDGWSLSNKCEIKQINCNLYAIVFVSKEVSKRVKPNKFIGVDVGIRQSISLSDGYIGRGLSKVIRKQKSRHAERRRQKYTISKKVKTNIKQILDREAKVVLRRSLATGSGISIEKPKRLANLRCGQLQGWARSYFGNRINILAKENGVYVEEVSPYQTSIICSKCLHCDKENRLGRIFRCKSCGHIDHADTNAAKNIERLASVVSDRKKSVGLENGKIHLDN